MKNNGHRASAFFWAVLLLFICFQKSTIPAAAQAPGATIAGVVTASDAGKLITIHGTIGGQCQVMTDSTFWNEYRVLNNGMRLSGIESAKGAQWVKKGAEVDITGRLSSVGEHIGVENQRYYPGYYVFSVSEVRPCRSRAHKATVFRVSEQPPRTGPQPSRKP
ncbi:MAG: hypothetical protein RDV48_29290 [Candidatus Eremiobacteraeota bacterium]|nr:hypothetical protein [Candidatus Eremiobacteraeota bacterium]